MSKDELFDKINELVIMFIATLMTYIQTIKFINEYCFKFSIISSLPKLKQ